MAGGLLTDLYELNMASSYLRRGMGADATFSLFVRHLPANRGFLVAAGLQDCLAWLEQFSFGAADLDYLASIGFDSATLESFRTLRFTGEVWGVPEGRLLFGNEPLLEVTAPIAEAQLVETMLLNQMTFQTTIATKAARCRLAAAGKIDLVDFGFRRTQGIEAGCDVARLSAMVGFASTSNVEAARRFGLRPAGTMAHSYIEAFPTELEAFRAFAEDFPERTTFLVDTYDTLAGVAQAIRIIQDLGLEDRAGVRLDSGDLGTLARQTRALLDAAGLPAVRIFVSGSLDEHDLAAFVAGTVPIDAAGIGTRMGVSADAPFLDSAYKLVAYDGRAVAKQSTGKVTLPGAKQVFRGAGMADTIGLRQEPAPPGTTLLLERVMAGGHRLAAREPLGAARERFETDLHDLPPPAQELDRPEAPRPMISDQLLALVVAVRAATGHRIPAGR